MDSFSPRSKDEITERRNLNYQKFSECQKAIKLIVYIEKIFKETPITI